MDIPGERIEEEGSEDSEDTDTASIGDIDESSAPPSMLSSDSGILSPDSGIVSPGIPSSLAHTRSHVKAKKKLKRLQR